jgi:hypothetical protein
LGLPARLAAPFGDALAAARAALARSGVRLPRTLPDVAALVAGFALFQLMLKRMSYTRDLAGSPAMLQEWGIIPGSPWLTRYCMEFATPDPLGCVAWYAEVHALSWSAALALVGLVFGVIGLMIWLRRLPTRPAAKPTR